MNDAPSRPAPLALSIVIFLVVCPAVFRTPLLPSIKISRIHRGRGLGDRWGYSDSPPCPSPLRLFLRIGESRNSVTGAVGISDPFGVLTSLPGAGSELTFEAAESHHGNYKLHQVTKFYIQTADSFAAGFMEWHHQELTLNSENRASSGAAELVPLNCVPRVDRRPAVVARSSSRSSGGNMFVIATTNDTDKQIALVLHDADGSTDHGIEGMDDHDVNMRYNPLYSG